MLRLNDSSLCGNQNNNFFVAHSIVKEGENNNTVQVTNAPTRHTTELLPSSRILQSTQGVANSNHAFFLQANEKVPSAS